MLIKDRHHRRERNLIIEFFKETQSQIISTIKLADYVQVKANSWNQLPESTRDEIFRIISQLKENKTKLENHPTFTLLVSGLDSSLDEEVTAFNILKKIEKEAEELEKKGQLTPQTRLLDTKATRLSGVMRNREYIRNYLDGKVPYGASQVSMDSLPQLLSDTEKKLKKIEYLKDSLSGPEGLQNLRNLRMQIENIANETSSLSKLLEDILAPLARLDDEEQAQQDRDEFNKLFMLEKTEI